MYEYNCPSIDDKVPEPTITEEELEHNFRQFRKVLSPDLKGICQMDDKVDNTVFFEPSDQTVPSSVELVDAKRRRHAFSSSSRKETIDDDELFGDGQPNHGSIGHHSVSSLPDLVTSSPEVTPAADNPCKSPDIVLTDSYMYSDKYQLKKKFEGNSFHPLRHVPTRSVSFDKDVKPLEDENSLPTDAGSKRRDFSSGYVTGESDEKESKAGSVKSQFSNTSSVFNDQDQIVPEMDRVGTKMNERSKSDSISTLCSANSSEESCKSTDKSNKEFNLSDGNEPIAAPRELNKDLTLPNLSILSSNESLAISTTEQIVKPYEIPCLSIFDSGKQLTDAGGNVEYFTNDESVLLSGDCLSKATESTSESSRGIIDESELEFVKKHYLKNSPDQTPNPNFTTRNEELLKEKISKIDATEQPALTRVPLVKPKTKTSDSYRSLLQQTCSPEVNRCLAAGEFYQARNILIHILDRKSSSSPRSSDEDPSSSDRNSSPIDLTSAFLPLSEPFDVEFSQKVKGCIEAASRCQYRRCKDRDCLKGRQHIDTLQNGLQVKSFFTNDVGEIIWGLRFHAEDCEEFDGKCAVPWCSFFQQHSDHTYKNQYLFNKMKEKTRATVKQFIVLQDSKKFVLLQDNAQAPVSEGMMMLSPLGDNEKTVLASCGVYGEVVIKKTSRKYFDEGIAEDSQPLHVLEKMRGHKHPHIVQFFWYSLHENDLFTCTAFYKSSCIQDHQNRFKLKDIKIIMRCAISAAMFLLEKYIVYLNWEAKNMLFDGSIEKLKLFNFTAAVSLDHPDDIDYGALKYLLSPRLIPPELFKSKPYLCHKSEVHGMGHLFYELVNGKPVWWELRHKERATIWKQIHDKSPCVSQDMPGPQKLLLDRCWETQPENRANVEELKNLIENCR